MIYLPSLEPECPRLARILTLMLLVVTVSGCATSTVTENKMEGQPEIYAEENHEDKKETKKHRNRSWNKLWKSAAKETGRTDKRYQERSDELKNRHPDIENKQGYTHSQPKLKKKEFWSRFKKWCPHPACRIQLLMDFASWGYNILSTPPP